MDLFRVNVRRIAVWVDRWHWVWLIVAAPFLLFPSASRSPAMLIVPTVWLIGLIAASVPLRRTPFNVALLLMFVMVLVSEWATYDLEFSLPKIAGMILGIGVFFAVIRYSDTWRAWWRAFAVFIAFELAAAGFALIGTSWLSKVSFLSPIIARLPARITGLPGAEQGLSPNELAGAFLWVLPILFVLLVMLTNQYTSTSSTMGIVKARILFILTVAVTCFVLAMLILTQSRSGYIGLAAGLGVMTFVILSRRWQIVLGVLVLVGVFALVLVPQGIGWNGVAQNVLASPSTDPALSLDTLEGRLEVWSRAIYGIQDFPITGMGMNTFRKIVNVLYPLFLVSPDYDIAHAHNEFLQAALDLGIPGLASFIALYLVAFWMLLQIWRGTRSPNDSVWVKALTIGFSGGLVAHIAYGLTDAVALGAKPGFIFWMLLGLIAALYEKLRSGKIVASKPSEPRD